jgi:transposase InsO family protein
MLGGTMPWKESDRMSLRLEFVTLASQPDANIRQLCRDFNICPTTGYKWLGRFEGGGKESLQDQSRRPHQSPDRTPKPVEEQVVALRQQHPAWGGRKLRRRLEDLGYKDLPAPSTVTGILRRHGLIVPEQNQNRGPMERFERPAPNQLWQMDFKGHFALASGRCHPLTVLDDHSRFNVVLEACANEQETTVETALRKAFEHYGMPDAILCDNGSPWGGGEHTGLTIWLLRLGVGVYHGRAYHPQTQGKEERFHRTLKAEVLQKGGWSDWAQVQRSFDQWRSLYNCERPHEALGLATPASRYQLSQRRYPTQLPTVEYAPGVDVRRVDCNGFISYRNQPQKIGRAFIKQIVGLRTTQTDEIIEVLFATKVIKTIDLRQNTPITPQ